MLKLTCLNTLPSIFASLCIAVCSQMSFAGTVLEESQNEGSSKRINVGSEALSSEKVIIGEPDHSSEFFSDLKAQWKNNFSDLTKKLEKSEHYQYERLQVPAPEAQFHYIDLDVIKEALRDIKGSNVFSKYIQLGHKVHHYRKARRVKSGEFHSSAHQNFWLDLFCGEKKAVLKADITSKSCAKNYFSDRNCHHTVPWVKSTINHFGMLGSVEGVLPETLLKITKIMDNNSSVFSQYPLSEQENILSGIGLFHTELLAELDRAKAIPVRIGSLNEKQQKAMLAVFLQGSSINTYKAPKQIQADFCMESLGKGDSGLSEALSIHKSKISVDEPLINYDTFFLVSQELEQTHPQLLWLGFHESKLYMGLYPAEGLLLAYEIPYQHQIKFFNAFYKMIGSMKVMHTPDLDDSSDNHSGHLMLLETFYLNTDETDGYKTCNNAGIEGEECTDGKLRHTVEMDYKPDGSFKLKVISNPDEEDEDEDDAQAQSLHKSRICCCFSYFCGKCDSLAKYIRSKLSWSSAETKSYKKK